ncbi:hypothetical protein [Microbacterium sp.]|uniref:hypothetical protein n=1 Tax=Microbacterium sp. TaxID=51671 RepID=UPI002616586B|nr:hypothetical protein [Microbacterium sp.]
MSTKTSGAATDSMWVRIADSYRRIIVGWVWLIPALTGCVGLVSSVFSTRVFLALWAGLAVFAALTVVTLLLRGIRIPAGWAVTIVLLPFIGEVGVMSYFMLLLAAGAYIALLAVYGVFAAIASVARGRQSVPATV